MSTNFHLLFINYAEPLTSDIVRNCQFRFSSTKDKHKYKQRVYFKHVVFHTANEKAIRGREVADSAHGDAKVHFTSSGGASFSMDNLLGNVRLQVQIRMRAPE